MKILFKQVAVASVHGLSQPQDFYVSEGKISAPFPEEEADEVVQGEGKVLMPGMIDPHVHFRTPGAPEKETFETGSASAVMGGVTSVLDMPNTNPPTYTVEKLEEKRALVAGKSYANYGFHFAAVGSGNLEEIKKAHNIPAVKIYMGSSTGDLLVDKPSVWEAVFEVCRDKGIPTVVHAENEARIKERSQLFAKDERACAHAHVRDCECAHIATKEALRLQAKVGNHLHVAHMSTKLELEDLLSAKSEKVTFEVCPHHLLFTMDDMVDGFLKMNPPLRSEEDKMALWQALRLGQIPVIATDHAPHTKEEKALGKSAPSGVPGVEFVLPLMLQALADGIIDWAQLVQITSANTAKIFAIQGKGSMEVGADADLVLVDPEMEKTIQESDILSKCGWSPYTGLTLQGWPVMTLVNGRIVMNNRKLLPVLAGKELIFKHD